jgi:hypothetical protein
MKMYQDYLMVLLDMSAMTIFIKPPSRTALKDQTTKRYLEGFRSTVHPIKHATSTNIRGQPLHRWWGGGGRGNRYTSDGGTIRQVMGRGQPLHKWWGRGGGIFSLHDFFGRLLVLEFKGISLCFPQSLREYFCVPVTFLISNGLPLSKTTHYKRLFSYPS